jgi:hypothetical protein
MDSGHRRRRFKHGKGLKGMKKFLFSASFSMLVSPLLHVLTDQPLPDRPQRRMRTILLPLSSSPGLIFPGQLATRDHRVG